MEKVKHSGLTYAKHALMHPWHVVVLAGAVTFGVAQWSILVLLAVFFSTELILFLVVTNLKAFRDYVDERLARIARGKAAEIRTSTLLQLREEERKQFYIIERKIDNLRNRFASFPAVSTLAVGECQELLGQYIKLGIQLNLMFAAEGIVTIPSLEYLVKELKMELEKNPNPIIEQRLAITARRLEVFKAAHSERTMMMHRLAAIHEMICLKTETSVISMPTDNFTNLKVRVGDSSVDELMEYSQVEEIDMDAIQFGR